MKKITNDTVVLKRDKVYSSYYARACKIIPDWRLVAISVGIPDNFGGEILRELNPPSKLLYEYKNNEYDANAPLELSILTSNFVDYNNQTSIKNLVDLISKTNLSKFSFKYNEASTSSSMISFERQLDLSWLSIFCL